LNLRALQRLSQNRFTWAVFFGLLWSLAFPKTNLAGFAWLVPAGILFSAQNLSSRESFRIGYLAGLTHYLTSLYWLLRIPFPAGAIIGWLALGLYLALYPAIWVWLCWRLCPSRASSSKPELQDPSALFRRSTWLARAGWAFGCAVIWVALEIILARLFSGFPWDLLGVSQYEILPLAQLAAITGVYGISFLIVWVSIGLGIAAVRFAAQPLARSAWLAELALPFLATTVVLAYGVRELSQPQPPRRASLVLALVQPSIPQTLIWDESQNDFRFRQLIELSEKALAEKPDLLVWPEAAVPNLLRWHRPTYDAVMELVRKHHCWMILGADDLEPRRNSTNPNDVDFYNSSFLIDPDGEIIAAYRKRQLVIFGEYTPFSKWLPFLKTLLPAGEGFRAGQKPVQFPLRDWNAVTSVLICFEDVFPHVSRNAVEPGRTDFLINLTNNGWFGETAAQWQHAANAVFRAIENRVPLVRCTNNGLTCWIDARGVMHDVYFEGSRNIYQAGFKLVRIPLLREKQPETFYHAHGDWFAWGCVGGGGLMMMWRFGKRTKEMKAPAEELSSPSRD